MSTRFESIAWLRRRLGDRVQEVAVQGDQPLLLDDPSCAYVTLSEHHQLFCVGYQGGQAVGRREHLALCEPGQLIFGLEPRSGPDATALLLSGVTGSVVWRVPMASLWQLASDADGRRMLAELFDSWIELLIAALPTTAIPTRAQIVQPGETVGEEGAWGTLSLRADKGLLWIAPRTPPETYRGLSVAKYGVQADAWPLSDSAWAECAAEPMRVWSTERLLEASSDASFASGFYSFVVAVVSARRGEVADTRLRRDAASHSAEREAVASALSALAAVGSGQRLDAAPVEAKDPFERACRHIARFLDLPREPRIAAPAGNTLSHMQAALARMTGVRTRGVLLEGEWYRQDAGPMLGFFTDTAEALQPVALLPRRRGYRVYDPQADAVRPLTAAEAENLHPQAYQFYRPFPSKPLEPLDVLRFSSAGTAPDVLRVLGVGMAAGALGTLLPLLTGLVFDRIIPGAERGLLWQLVLVLLAVYLGSSLFDLARAFSLVRAQTRMDAALEAGVWDRLLSLPLPFFRDYSAGDLSARAAGIGSIREVLAQVGLSTILSGVFSIWTFGLLFYFDLRLALAATGLVALSGLVAAIATFFDLGLKRRLTELDGRISGLVLQLLDGIAKLRVSGSEQRAFAVWARLFARRRDAELAGERIHNRVAVFQAIYPVLCSGALFWFVAGGGGQTLSTGQFLAFSSAFGSFLRSVLDVIGASLQTLALVPLYERAKPILTSPTENQGEVDMDIELDGSIEVSHVSFRYHADSPLVLDDVDLRIEPGEFVAIVGPSGSGKSTLLRMLLGFETPTEGGVFYDGQALTSLDIRAVRRQIGVVLQHSRVMAGDIFTNIVGNTGLGIDDAWRAARQAAFDKDIEEMPMGMHTVLAQGGGTLSGGQRQRLLIARALAAQPKMLFFDEATSALDNRTQAAVSESLEQLKVTRVVIAHRLSTIQHADRIVVIEGGRVVQVGRFESLLEEGGTFAALAKRQMV